MKRFLLKLMLFVAALTFVAVISVTDAPTGLAISIGISAVSGFAIFHPLPRIGLSGRAYSALVFIFIGLFGVITSNEQRKVDLLKASDPAAYLAGLEETNHTKWQAELKVMKPEQYTALQADQAAKDNAARLSADENSIRSDAQQMKWQDAAREIGYLTQDGGDLAAFRAEVEKIVLPMVQSLSTSSDDLAAAADGYSLLAALQPDNKTYADKAKASAQRLKDVRAAAVRRLQVKTDKVEGIMWYQDPSAPKYLNSRSTAYLYIGRRGDSGAPFLRLKVQYTASDWLFVQDVVAWHDGIKEELVSGPFERDNNSTIWEWEDVQPDDLQIAILRDLATAKEAILRFDGQQYHRDVTLSAVDKQAILNVLTAYDALQAGY